MVSNPGAVCALMCAALVGCSSEPTVESPRDGGSDASHDARDADLGPMELRAARLVDEGLPLVLLNEGDALPLSAALQGGHVMYVAAQVSGLHSNIAEIEATLRFPDNGAILNREARTVAMRELADEPGWWQPDIRSRSQVAHIPACPNYDDRSLRDEEWLLDIKVIRTEDGESASTTLRVTPTCEFTDSTLQARCECECEPDYFLGKCN